MQHNYVGDQQPEDKVNVLVNDDKEENEMSQDENVGDALKPP